VGLGGRPQFLDLGLADPGRRRPLGRRDDARLHDVGVEGQGEAGGFLKPGLGIAGVGQLRPNGVKNQSPLDGVFVIDELGQSSWSEGSYS